MEKRILFVDNDHDFLETRSEHLERAGFVVFKAETVAAAEGILAERWIHLLVIDVRLRDDNDDRDMTGLSLAKNEKYRSIPKIILTRFSSYELVREALGPRLNGQAAAVNFLDKTEGAQAAIEAVKDAFEKHVGLDHNLVMRWADPRSEYDLLTHINQKVSGLEINERASELVGLFSRLFYGRRQITVNRLFSQTEGRVTLYVSAFSTEGLEEQFLVICGVKSLLAQEEENYSRFVPQTTSVGGTIKVNSTATTHFGAIAYRLIGGDLDEISTLSEFYAANPADRINQAMDSLFTQTLTPWYRQGSTKERRSIKSFFLPSTALNGKSLLQSQLPNQIADLQRHGLIVDLPNLDHLAADLVAYLQIDEATADLTTRWGITHGRLNGETILVDRQGRTWLTDFSQVGPGPLLQDFVDLETAIKLDLLPTLNLRERYRLAQADLTPDLANLSVEAGPELPEMQKARQVIQAIRRLAAQISGPDPNVYQHGLLLRAIAKLSAYKTEITYTHRERLPYLHSLISAALFSQYLAPTLPNNVPLEARESLWIDEGRKEIWVEGRSVRLAPGEYKLLMYLYRHADQICTFSDISEHVFETQFPSDLNEQDKKQIDETRRHAAIGRLRKEIESNPRKPKYIETIRGDGYRLKLGLR